ncbi:hypothetical protein LCGC14_1465010 [marine sediment metagenome]|uniref:Ubiquitin-activating enzyme E1 FCCH domain-containing protein n=1 Tax=marine sediment metagenome TaxID=412755 RepID=A0A0F9MFV8_9ZZZZ
MGTGGDFWNARNIEVKNTKAVTLSARVNAVVGQAVTHIVRPAGNPRFIAFQVLSNGFYVKPGYHPGRTFLDEDIAAATDRLTDTAHGFTAGDGPYQLTSAGPVLAGSPGVIISTLPELLTRDAGSWLDEGFAVNQTVTLGGSASNDGPLTITAVTALVITVAETLVAEGSQTDLTLTATGELPTGLDLLTDYFVGVIDANTYTLHTNHNDATKGQNLVDVSTPEMVLLTSVVIAAGPDGTFTRTVGSWLTEGFQVGDDIIVSGSASNNSDFTVTVVTDLVLSVSATLTAEGAQTDLVITAQFPGGIQTIAAMATANPSATNEDGQDAPLIDSTAGKGGEVGAVIAMPSQLTVAGDNAGSNMVYWFLP